jgi:beta-lactamase superfamily II metal-dependent hydrolase
MSDELVVRIYNVRFGDAILVIVPDRDPSTGKTVRRRILIDVGNAPLVASQEGGDDAAFKPVIDHILDELNGEPLDLYVMTHEHLDHVQGLPHAAWKLFQQDAFLDRFKVRHVWLTASAEGEAYYDRFPEAKKQKLSFDAQLKAIDRFLATRPDGHALFAQYLKNNDPTKTSQCVEFLRKLNPEKTAFIYRGAKLKGTHPFKEAKFEIWAPEENTAEYYGRFQPLSLDGTDGMAPRLPAQMTESPPAGVDLGAFLNLVDARRGGISDNLLAIDQAANNTSIVFLLTWRGWKLLFAGDAETRSWKTMDREGMIQPVHFLKVAHHGSHNGTPTGDIFEKLLPKKPSDKRKRVAAISSWTETYSGIPHEPTNERLKSRCQFFSTLDDTQASHYEISFAG